MRTSQADDWHFGKHMKNPLEIGEVRPEELPGYLVCDGCWKQLPKNETKLWMYFNFRNLKAQWLCQECQPDWKGHFEMIQSQGL